MNNKVVISKISKFIDEKRIIDNYLYRIAYSVDASLYQLIPEIVIIVNDANEVQQLIDLANLINLQIAFRASGTSLSGQALSSNILVVLSNLHWQNYKISHNRELITLQCGVIGGVANKILKIYNKKIGPDPASIDVAKIGGIIANNSSGMCCGTKYNSYNTLFSIKAILANGSYIDTSNASSINHFKKNNLALITGINNIRNKIINDNNLYNFIKQKFSIKNTSAYSLNAFLDFEDPVDIISHLIVGSEGTLAFIEEVQLKTIDITIYKELAFLIFENIDTTINFVLDFINLKLEINIDAMELLDDNCLFSIKNLEKSKNYLNNIPINSYALLIEISSNDKTFLEDGKILIQNLINKIKIYRQIGFTSDETINHDLWELRKGILTTVGANKENGSTLIIEDIAIKIDYLLALINELIYLFKKYDFNNHAIFGHVLFGNIHFIFTPNFNFDLEIIKYDLFMKELIELVNKYSGSLKAEHGCGRNMASFIYKEWGKDLYNIMWKIKKLFDPNNILNKDVILSKDKNIHLKNLKKIPQIDPIIDSCIECGFCEQVCPSKNYTLTPRQRITCIRYSNFVPKKFLNTFKKDYKFYGINSCVSTSMCATKCPVAIDTGQLMLKLREKPNLLLINFISNKFYLFIYFAKQFIKIAKLFQVIFNKNFIFKISKLINSKISSFPICLPTLPESQNVNFKSIINNNSKQIIYFPSCPNRIFKDTEESSFKKNAILTLLSILEYDVIIPNNIKNLCCGQMFSSLGFSKIAKTKQNELFNSFKNNNLDILVDNSSCLFFLNENDTNFNLIGINDFIIKEMHNLKLYKKYNKIAIHYDCSISKLKKDNIRLIKEIISKCADEIIITEIECCGFAGFKGFTMPKLNKSALNGLDKKIEDCDIGVTFNRNCQIGLSCYGNKKFISLAELIVNSANCN